MQWNKSPVYISQKNNIGYLRGIMLTLRFQSFGVVNVFKGNKVSVLYLIEILRFKLKYFMQICLILQTWPNEVSLRLFRRVNSSQLAGRRIQPKHRPWIFNYTSFGIIKIIR